MKAGVASWGGSTLNTKGARLDPDERRRNESCVAIENSMYLVEVSRERGLIRRAFDKKSGIDPITEPRLDNYGRSAGAHAGSGR